MIFFLSFKVSLMLQYYIDIAILYWWKPLFAGISKQHSLMPQCIQILEQQNQHDCAAKLIYSPEKVDHLFYFFGVFFFKASQLSKLATCSPRKEMKVFQEQHKKLWMFRYLEEDHIQQPSVNAGFQIFLCWSQERMFLTEEVPVALLQIAVFNQTYLQYSMHTWLTKLFLQKWFYTFKAIKPCG